MSKETYIMIKNGVVKFIGKKDIPIKIISSNKDKSLSKYDEKYILLNSESFLNEIGIENETTLYYMIKLNEEVETLMEIKRHWNLNNNWSRDLHLRNWDEIEVHEDSEEKFIVKLLCS